MPGADTITLPSGIYTLSIAGADEQAAKTGDLDITDDLTISGAVEATTIVDGGGLDRVFEVRGFIKGIIVNFSRGPAFRPRRDIRGIARLCTASLGTGPPAHRRRNDRSGS